MANSENDNITAQGTADNATKNAVENTTETASADAGKNAISPSGVTVTDVTRRGTGVGIVGGVRAPKTEKPN